MNLPYGDYKLKVRNISFKDEAELNEISLGITIIPGLCHLVRLSLIYITDIIRHRQHRLFLPFQVIAKKLTGT